MAEFMDRYFQNGREYPDISGEEPILELGTLWSYVANTMLNGFINYPKIISANLITRYRSQEENLRDLEKYRAYCKGEAYWHSDLNKWFNDDLHLLGQEDLSRAIKNPGDSIVYWYFWYDQDSSDCCIGRFQTSDTLAVVVKYFEAQCQEYAATHNYGDEKSNLIDFPVKLLRGWMNY